MTNQPIKITTAEGITIELANVDQLPSVMPLLTGGATIQVEVPSAAPAPTPEPAAVQQPLEGMPEPGEPSTTTRRQRPNFVYVTEREARVMSLLRKNPNGMTTAEIAREMGLKHNVLSASVSHLRFNRPSRDTNNPLVVRVNNGLMKATQLGMKVKLRIEKRPDPHNRASGWGE